jgi:hypothetical protein
MVAQGGEKGAHVYEAIKKLNTLPLQIAFRIYMSYGHWRPITSYVFHILSLLRNKLAHHMSSLGA